MSIADQTARCDDDLDRIERAGLNAAQKTLARIRSGVMQSYRTGHVFSARAELLNHLTSAMARTLSMGHLLGVRRSRLMRMQTAPGRRRRPSRLSLDHFSELRDQITAAGMADQLPGLQAAYTRKLYGSLNQLGGKIDAATRATVASIVTHHEPPGRALNLLSSVLDKLGVGMLGQSKLETIYRTASALAYNAGRWQDDKANWDTIWGFTYRTMRDDRVRPEHAAMDGTTLPKDDPIWRKWTPPCGWNCRCLLVTLYETPKRAVQPGKLDGLTPEPDEGFAFNPGDLLPYRRPAKVVDRDTQLPVVDLLGGGIELLPSFAPKPIPPIAPPRWKAAPIPVEPGEPAEPVIVPADLGPLEDYSGSPVSFSRVR